MHSKTRYPSSYPNCRPCCCGLRKGCRHVIARARSLSGNSDPRGAIISLHFISEFTLDPCDDSRSSIVASLARTGLTDSRSARCAYWGNGCRRKKNLSTDSDATRQTGSHIPSRVDDERIVKNSSSGISRLLRRRSRERLAIEYFGKYGAISPNLLCATIGEASAAGLACS